MNWDLALKKLSAQINGSEQVERTVSKNRSKHNQKWFIVGSSNAVVYPHAMMIKVANTSIASSTVFGTFAYSRLAVPTIQQYQTHISMHILEILLIFLIKMRDRWIINLLNHSQVRRVAGSNNHSNNHFKAQCNCIRNNKNDMAVVLSAEPVPYDRIGNNYLGQGHQTHYYLSNRWPICEPIYGFVFVCSFNIFLFACFQLLFCYFLMQHAFQSLSISISISITELLNNEIQCYSLIYQNINQIQGDLSYMKAEKCGTQTEAKTNQQHVSQTKMFKRLLDIQKYFQKYSSNSSDEQSKEFTRNKRDLQGAYNNFSIIDKNDTDRLKYSKIFQTMFKAHFENKQKIDPKVLQLDVKTQRAIACFLGLAIGDALGSTTEFCPFDKNRTSYIQYDFNDLIKRSKEEHYDRSGSVNIWTDDCSMALSLADSLLLNQYKLNPKHSRFMYHMWLHHGLNNGGRPYSIGLGGNISISTGQFRQKRQDFTEEGNRFNNGNGSLMRLGPIPVNYFNNEQQGMSAAEQQSKTTHNGLEAKECCRLLTLIIIRLINRQQQKEWKSVIEKACQDFKTQVPSVKYLALSQPQPQQLYTRQAEQFKNFTLFNKKLADRNWNWKAAQFTYSPSRADNMPGYVGSYCMDALSMALHTVWHSKSYHQVALKNANMGGDCDTVGAIAGQIAGAVYGIDSEMLHLYGQMEDAIKGRYQVFLKAYKLAKKPSIYQK